MKKQNFLLLFIFILLFACNSGYDYKADNFEIFFSVKPKSLRKEKIESIVLQEIKLDSIPSSYIGKISYRNDTIFFVDYRFCKVFVFNSMGENIGKYLGQGKGRNEIPAGILQAHVPLQNGNHFFMGEYNDAYCFDCQFKRILQYQIIWKNSQTEQQELKNPYPDNQMLYDLGDEIIFQPREYGESVYFQIFSMHPQFNMLVDDYYKYSRIIAKLDIKTGVIKDLLGRRSPVYQQYKYLIYEFFSFDISKNGQFFVSFPPDSLIYVYDNSFKPLKTFGCAGRNMNTHYKEIHSFHDIKKYWESEKQNTGYYTWLEYFDKQNILFRSYTKGKNQQTDGLQIYEDGVLIGDIDVPKNFRVEGYIAPYFYSNEFIDEENEKIRVYKFKLSL